MEEYRNAYYKLFNTVTDITQEIKKLVEKMEVVQLKCEEMIIMIDENGVEKGN